MKICIVSNFQIVTKQGVFTPGYILSTLLIILHSEYTIKLQDTFCELLANHKQYIAVLFHTSQESTKPHGTFMNATLTQKAAVSQSLFHTSQ